MNKDNIERFKDAPWLPKERLQIIIGGAGGISSWLALLLSRINVDNNLDITVYDFDKIEKHNLGGQFYSTNQIGLLKVSAVRQNIKLFSDCDIKTYGEYKKDSLIAPIMFSGFDNMSAREIFFSNWKTAYNNIKNDVVSPIFIDGRLNAEQIQIFCVDNEDKIKEYEKKLFPENYIADAPCTFKQTSHIATMIASYMVSFFTNHLANCYQQSGRTVPFFFEVITPLNLSTENVLV